MVQKDTQELSKFIGRASSSPFATCLRTGQYSYDDFIGIEGFVAGWESRIRAAGSVEDIAPRDKAFYNLCQKSIEIAAQPEFNNPLTWDDREKLLDKLVELKLIQMQISFE